jgi:hypothetical protein
MLRLELNTSTSNEDNVELMSSDNLKSLNKKLNKMNSILIGEIAVNEKSSVLALKDLIYSSWNQLFESIQNLSSNESEEQKCNSLYQSIQPASRDHIRLRDGKVLK